MVKTEEGSTMADSWGEVFERGRLIPAPSHTVRLAAENHFTESHGFQLSFGRLSAPHIPQPDLTYQLRATLFDQNHQLYFGKTWKSPSQKMKHNKISFNEVLYFHTSLRLPSTLVVVELVSMSLRPDGSQQVLGQGFTLLELFRPEAPAAEGDRRLNLHHGSPRLLLHPQLKDTTHYDTVLKTIDGARLECVVMRHPAMDAIRHLLPENVLVSGHEDIPGLVPSPTGDAVQRPQLQKMQLFTLRGLSVSLQPNLDKFESQLLQLVNMDCNNTKQPGSEGTLRTVVIQERRLHVGVHNGWCFLDKPQVVVLEPLASGAARATGGRAGSASKQSGPDSSAPAHLSQVLGFRSSLELMMTNHQALAIVFQLEYVFSAPTGRETMLSSTSSSRAAFLQTLRWGIFFPFQQPSDWRGEELQLVLHGGAKPNPYGVMVYSTGTSAKTQDTTAPAAAAAAQVKDTVSFRLSCGLEKKAAQSPKASLRSGQGDVSHERKLPSSPSPGQKLLPAASPPESPQGPGASSAVTAQHEDHSDGDQLEELPFSPIHAPVITVGLNLHRSSSVSSRASQALLNSAGFPDIVDHSGQLAEVLDPTEPVTFDPRREEVDPLQDDLLVFQFLAFTRVPAPGVGPDWPGNVHFTFQFYRFPPVTSQQLRLLSGDKVQQRSANPLPCVLASINRDGTVNSGSPGLQLHFRVDHSFLQPGEKRWFLRYLALHTLHIDIWDSDSQLLIGSTAIELKYLLRQGKAAVQALHEVEVLTTDYVAEDVLLASAGLDQHSSSSFMTAKTIVKGHLHVRTGNIGCPGDPSSRRRRSPADETPSPSYIIRPCKGNSGFRGGSLSPGNILQLNARNIAPGPETDGDRAAPSQQRRRIGPDSATPGGVDLNEPDGGRRKMEQTGDGRQRDAREGAEAAKVTADGAYISPSAERSKAEGIANMLRLAITTQHRLYASLGSAHYLEFVLRNPFNFPQTVTIHSDDPELSVITSTEEWRHFKALTQTATQLEENMFHWEPGAPGPRVYLRPKESVHIPLKYQSFLCDHTSSLQGPSFLPTGRGGSSQMAKKTLSNIIAAKSIKVTFSTDDGKPMSICQVEVEPTPHVLDRTFRLYHPELCYLKKALRLLPWQDPADAAAEISVRCSDPDVICQSTMLVPGEPQHVYLKVPGSPSPHVKMFFVMIYTDKWTAAPAQIWQIYVHFLERVDLSCVSGQRTCQSLVLRGRQSVRKVKCFSSHPEEIQVDPEGVFVLPPSAVQELQVQVQPWRPGGRFLYLNAVDVESRRLVTAWLLCLNVHQPLVSKEFSVSVAVGGRGSSKKISYTNLYTSSRRFLLRSDHPDLLQFKEDQFQIDAKESYNIGLRFASSQGPGSVKIHVYVNNLEEKTEETFSVMVNYE